jgi:hypothetical protein
MKQFLQADLPNAATHRPQAECGFAIYRGVLVQWDEDHDDRVLQFLDEFPAGLVDRLVVVQEHEAKLLLVWHKAIPNGYESGTEIDVDGDLWHVESSVAIEPPKPKTDERPSRMSN